MNVEKAMKETLDLSDDEIKKVLAIFKDPDIMTFKQMQSVMTHMVTHKIAIELSGEDFSDEVAFFAAVVTTVRYPEDSIKRNAYDVLKSLTL